VARPKALSKLGATGTFEPLLVALQRAARREHQIDVAESCDQIEHVRHVEDECGIDSRPERDGMTSMSSVGSEDQ
jgi:hypothetical protein